MSVEYKRLMDGMKEHVDILLELILPGKEKLKMVKTDNKQVLC
jgi:hypothetical protein